MWVIRQACHRLSGHDMRKMTTLHVVRVIRVLLVLDNLDIRHFYSYFSLKKKQFFLFPSLRFKVCWCANEIFELIRTS